MSVLLSPDQQKEEFNSRLTRFKADLLNLMENYKLEILPVITYAPYGIIPQLSINDKKYEKLSSASSSAIIQPEQFTKDEKSLAADKEVMERAAKARKK